MISVEESKENKKTLILSSALAELVVVNKEVKKIKLRMGLKRKMKIKLRYRRRCKCQVMVKGSKKSV